MEVRRGKRFFSGITPFPGLSLLRKEENEFKLSLRDDRDVHTLMHRTLFLGPEAILEDNFLSSTPHDEERKPMEQSS
ncbi:hypothetical protein NPIL_663521 [Nephila pilipes]|uniref:Uncharacterized protein n=1 Tax=Nephila pilipes TaxID=299642 RepID=A0A8X6MTV5_NEPPI|nr:hypothetical protein NPIL_663521 [Nephila pilipes]